MNDAERADGVTAWKMDCKMRECMSRRIHYTW